VRNLRVSFSIHIEDLVFIACCLVHAKSSFSTRNICRNDPNTGRIAGAIGSFMGKFFPNESVDKMSLTLGGRTIFNNGKFVLEGDAVEKELSAHMFDAQLGENDDFPKHQKFVEIGVDFGGNGSNVIVLGSDLTKEYVEVNADYRS